MAQVTWESFHNSIDTGNADDTSRDPDLVTIRAAVADRAAFAPLYQRYAQPVFGYCMRRLADRERAADATSQTFIRALTALPKFSPDPGNPGATFRAWLFTIAHHVVTDMHRRHRPHTSLDAPDRDGDTNADQLRDPARSPEEQAMASDDARMLHSMLAILPERQRRIIELRLADLSGAEIAEALGMTISAVKSAQFRAYSTLRDHFPELRSGRPS